VVILARGGGSLEDLWPFNEERVARAIAASRVPIISAVGHETDFTIADFVADLRAPTPSAAAERVVQAKDEIGARIDGLTRRQVSAITLRLARVRARVLAVTDHRVFEAERGRVRHLGQRVDDLRRRADSALLRRAERARGDLQRTSHRAEAFRWDRQLAQRRQQVERLQQRLGDLAAARVRERRAAFARVAGKLDTLSPLSVLSRGYALVWDEAQRLVREPGQVAVGDALTIRVGGGRLGARVTTKEPQ
jgi:exodeoxyribonuclease VII large subunit